MNDDRPNRLPWGVLALTSVAVFAVALDTTVLFVAFTDLRRTFAAATTAQLSWVLNAYTIVFGALLVTAGRFADRIGRKRTFLSGVVVFTLASALCGVAPTPGILILSRVVQAIGAAMLMPTSLALVLAAFPREKHAIAVSIWGAVGALAAAIGPAVGSAIVQSVGWRWAFYLNVPVGLIALLRARSRLSESRAAAGGQLPDPFGVLLAIASPGLLALGIIGAGAWGPTGGRTLAAVLGSFVLLGALLLEVRRSRSPVIDLSLFRDRNYRLAAWATLVFSIGFTAMFFGLIQFLTNAWHYSILRAGLAISPGPLSVIPFAVFAGRFAARRGHRTLLVVGGLVYAANAFVLLRFASERPAYLTLFLPTSILVGLAIGFVLPSLSGVAVHGLDSDRFALGVAVNQAIRQVASVLGVAFVIAVATHAHGDALGPARAMFKLLIVVGLGTALIGRGVATAPGDTGVRAPKRTGPARQLFLPALAAAALVFSVVHVVRAQKPRVHPEPRAYAATESSVLTKPATQLLPMTGNRLAGNGVVEPSSENIHAGSHRAGVVAIVNAHAQDRVKKNDPLFCLDDRAATAELHARAADLTMARAQLERLQSMPRAEELPPLVARVGEAQARLDDADDSLRRTSKLVSQGASPEEQGVHVRQSREQALSSLRAAQAELALKRAGSWTQDRAVARAAVEQAAASVERAKTELDLLCARAPFDATVLRVDVRASEFVGAAPNEDLVTLGVLVPLHVRVDLDEVDIPRFRNDAQAQAFVRGGSGDGVPLRFVRVEPAVQPKKSLSGASAERIDTRVLQVLYAVDERTKATLFVGQQLDVYIETR